MALKKRGAQKGPPPDLQKTAEDRPADRRSFLNRLWLLVCAVVLGEWIWLVVSFLRPRRERVPKGDFGTVIEAGSVEAFSPNSVTAFPRGRFYLVRLEDGGFLALHRRCTHLGCTVPWIEEKKMFLCPCHSSAFDIRGEVIRAPAPRPLDIFPITVENNVIRVDTGKIIKRTGFRDGHVVRPDKGS